MKSLFTLSKYLAPVAIAASLSLAAPANALNIVLTNDDGWETDNIQVLFTRLKAAGHSVILSGPCTGQSGKGGALNFLRPVSIDTSKASRDEYCVGDTDTSVAFKDFSEGTPVMAALYGIDVAAQAKWGKQPDLLISGPNEGNNLGYLNNNSGTLGAAMIAIARGVPAIAVSAADGDAAKAEVVSDLVIAIIKKLEEKRAKGQPLLPAFTGLNVNTPADPAKHRGIKFTDVGWNSGGIDPRFTNDLASNELTLQYVAAKIAKTKGVDMPAAMAIAKQQLANKPGMTFSMGTNLVADFAETSEGVALKAGYVTISTIDGQVQASKDKAAQTKKKLKDLAKK